ncbi:MAG: UDP-N-acetylmuramoyl-tripeptide--D-alanyl-D-alanine ligase [Balneolaceae bacterium]|nr:UDP-N-acetylmuramoyl-tripeptide--D-alanyl-D-alanine ligase [Balneolaceae bacterium]
MHIFQQKGYKLNEYWQWLVEHWNHRVITGRHIFYMIIIVAMLWLVSSTITGSAAVIILTFFGLFWFGPFDYYQNEKQKKPLVYTARVLRLCVPYGILCLTLPAATLYLSYDSGAPYLAGFFSMLPVDIYALAFGWVLANAVVPFFIFIAAKITAPIERRVHQHFINKAQTKLARMPELTVIAITGSYGKTSTKFMIRDLLKERMSVCSTPGSYNTPMGICKVINNDLEAHHQVLILEMGARYEGNIDELCDIAEPNIAVVTNVGVAHLETFGSQEAIARTKSTLVKRLKANGTAVLNADDPHVADMANLRDDITVLNVGLDNGLIRGSNITYNHEGTHFTVHRNGETETFNTQLLGVHNVQNMLLAIGVASRFDIRLKTMVLAARTIEPIEHRLELKKQGDIYVINDAFNSNPTGAKNAVEILAQFNSGRRIIITPGMIELGELEDEKNREFGRQIGEANLDLVVLVGQHRTKAIQEGIRQTSFPEEQLKIAESLFKANELVEDYVQPGDIVLYENDLPDSFNE